MIRIFRHWLEVKRFTIELDAKLSVRRVARHIKSESARRGVQTKLEQTIAQQKQFWGIGA